MTNKQKINRRLKNVIRGQALVIKEDKTITQEEKIEQLGEVADLYEMVLRKEYEEEKRINISNLKKEIEEQTRNGRTQVYIKVDDFNVLTNREKIGKESRIFVNTNYLEELIKEYEDKNNLKYKLARNENNEELER